MEATTSGCEPYLNSAGERRCDDIIHFILTEYIPQHHVDAILISANWKGGEIDNIKATVALAKPYATHVIVMGPTVEYEGSAPRLLATSILKNDPTLMDRYRRTERRDMDTLFQTAFKNAGIEYISVYRTICPDSHCATADDTGLPIEFDYGHLTRGGPVLVARQIKETGLFPKEYTGPATPLGAVSVMQP
jgi:hypothetical protein